MMPVSNHMELIQTLNWNEEKRNNERWYIFLLMNPRNQTNAGIDIIKNFSYLDVRTGDVTFFLPGFSNMDQGIVPYRSENGCEVIYKDTSFGEIFFDEIGFLKTIAWLEQGSNNAYRYSEDLDLVIVRYHPRYTMPNGGVLYEQNFDLYNMIVYNLDYLKVHGVNTIRMITECMRIVSNSENEHEVKLFLDNYILDRINCKGKYMHQGIDIFVAGSKMLKRERDAVISALTHITNNSSRGYYFRVKTYEDFDRSLTDEGRQKEYNDYISNNAECAIFILDSTVGGITMEEFVVAINAYRVKKKPEIFVYSRMPSDEVGSFSRFFKKHEQSEEITTIRKHLSERGQYYIEYRDIDDLKNHIAQDFRRYGL